MNENNKISGIQFGLLIIGFTIGSTTVIFPGADTKQNIWIVLLLGFFGGLILIVSYSYISILNPNKSIIEIISSIFGKIFGKIICLLYIWYFIHLLSLVLRNFLEFMITTIYIETPMIFMAICIMFLEAYTVRKGITAIARNSVFLVTAACISIFGLFFTLFAEYDIDNLFPLLENGFKPLIKPSFGVMTFPFGELIIFLMIFPFLNKTKKTMKVSVIAVSISLFLILIALFRNLLALGPDLMARTTYPSYLAVKLVPKIDIEVFIVLDLIIFGGVKMSTCLYSAAIGLKQIFGLNSYKPFVFPIAMIAVFLSIWIYKDYFEMITWAKEVYPYYAIPFQILIPLAILIISIIKKKILKTNK